MTITSSPASFRGNIVHAMKQVAVSRCAWFFAAPWLAAALARRGKQNFPVVSMVVGFVLLALSLLVVGAAGPAPAVGSGQ